MYFAIIEEGTSMLRRSVGAYKYEVLCTLGGRFNIFPYYAPNRHSVTRARPVP